MFNRACLTAACERLSVRESKPPATGPGLHYRRFALATLGLAVLVAFGASDFSEPVTQPEERAVAAVPAMAPAKHKAKLARPAASWAMAGDAAADLGDADSSAAPGSAAPPAVTAPPIPSSGAAPVPQAAAAKADRPSPEELNRLIARSRARSGGVDQGDDPDGPVG